MLMEFTRLLLQNWRNFLHLDVPLQRRMFVVGPNAAGKSNLLDVFKFLRDVAEPQGGLRQAVEHPTRQGVSRIRSLYARGQSNVVVEVEALLDGGDPWTYRLEFGQNRQRVPAVRKEVVKHGQDTVLDRPDDEDREDGSRLTQTHVEQVNANRPFRKLADFLGRTRYLHIVPQLIREPDRSIGRQNDPYGGDFLEQLARTSKRTLQARLRKIVEALRVAVPQLGKLELQRDERGMPHLRGRFEHWRPQGAWQGEEQLSDGTLRLLGLLWVLLDGKHPLVLEEPELSLHPAVIRHIPPMMARLARPHGRQVLLSTHSGDLLHDEGIGAEELLLLRPGREGTEVALGANVREICLLLEQGQTAGETVMSYVAPANVQQLSLFGGP
jgi:predicted ATPase